MDFSKLTIKKIAFLLLLSIAFYWGLQNFVVLIAVFQWLTRLFLPFLVGGAMAFILNIPMRHIESGLLSKSPRLNRFRRPLAYLITLVFTLGVISLVVFVVVPELGRTFSLLADQIPRALSSLEDRLNTLSFSWPEIKSYLDQIDIHWPSMTQKAVSLVQSIASTAINSGFSILGSVIGGITTFFISFVFSIYLLMQKEVLSRQGKQVLYGLFPLHKAEQIIEILSLSNVTFSRFFSGQCIEAIILGAMFFFSMTLLGMPYALLVGVLIAVTALIPVVGAFIGCFVGAFLILIVNPWKALQFIILFLVLQQIEGNLIYPHVVGSSVGLPSIWVLAAVTIGGNLMGVAGMLLFIPLCSVCYALFRAFIKDRLKKREIPSQKWETPAAQKK